MAPLHRLAYLIPSLILALLATAGLSVAFIWRSREAQFYRQEYQSEAERRALSQRYEYLTRYANDIILVMDRDWKIVEANDQAVASYGYERRELFDLYLWDLFAATIPPSEVKRLALEAQDGLRFEAVHRRQDGTTFPAEISSSLMEIGQDQLYQYIIRDVSDRKRRERAIKESERQLRYLSSQLLIVQENERSRISKELHDELGQALMIVKYQISSIETRLPKNRKTLKEDCYAVIHYLDSTIENVRRLSRDLTPSALEQFGLSTAIKNLVEEFGKYIEIHWLPAQMKEINDLFSPLAQINIYRIFQEALTNIGKHAQASQILIDIAKRDKAMVFTIKDNGKGFDPKASPGDDKHKGIGVAAMHERARIAGGCLEIWSRPGQGTKLSFEIPVRQENN